MNKPLHDAQNWEKIYSGDLLSCKLLAIKLQVENIPFWIENEHIQGAQPFVPWDGTVPPVIIHVDATSMPRAKEICIELHLLQ